MESRGFLLRQGHRLLQIGVSLLLLTSFEGFAIPYFRVPRLALSAHSLCALVAVLLIGLGVAWNKLTLETRASKIAFWCLTYSSFAIIAAYIIAGALGAGSTTMAQAAGSAHGTPFQETLIKVVSYSSAPTGIISFALILWGLRRPVPDSPEE